MIQVCNIHKFLVCRLRYIHLLLDIRYSYLDSIRNLILQHKYIQQKPNHKYMVVVEVVVVGQVEELEEQLV
jgi:hypothetical protein